MPTKKAAPKKLAKTTKPAPKPAAKKQAPAKKAMASAKLPAKKTAPAKKQAPPAKKVNAVAKKAVPAKKANAAAKKSAPAKKQAAPPAKAVSKKPMAPAKKAPVPAKKAQAPAPKAPAKPAPKTAVKATLPAKKEQPVAKAKVPEKAEASKPAPKAATKAAPKKEPAKPVVIPKTTTDRKIKYEPDFTRSVLDKQLQQQKMQSGPTMRYSDAELEEFRDLINKKLDTAKKELNYLQGLITRKDESGDLDEGRYMTMEDGSMSMEREQLSQMASRQIQFIDHLEKANMRIENKTYGICRVTGRLIDKARLRAVPHATLSIEAKQMMNR